MDMTSLLNYRVEWTVILNETTQDKNKVLKDKRNETVKFHRLDRGIEEAVTTFQSVVEADQRNGGPQKKRPLEENENPAIRSNKEYGMNQAINRCKGVQSRPIGVGVEAREEACGDPPPPPQKRELYTQGRDSTVSHYHQPISK